MSLLLALLVLVVGVAVAFWILDKIKASGAVFPPIAYAIAYLIVGVLALLALYAILAGPLSLPALK